MQSKINYGIVPWVFHEIDHPPSFLRFFSFRIDQKYYHEIDPPPFHILAKGGGGTAGSNGTYTPPGVLLKSGFLGGFRVGWAQKKFW